MSTGDRQLWSDWGPLDGPILERDQPPAMGLYESPACEGMPIGMALPVGWVQGSKAPVATLTVGGKEELEGLFLCDRRQFVPLGEAAE